MCCCLQVSTDQVAHLQTLLSTSRNEGRQRDKLILKNKQLESNSHFARVAQDKMLRSLQSKYRCETAFQGLGIDRGIATRATLQSCVRSRVHRATKLVAQQGMYQAPFRFMYAAPPHTP